jgi:poly-beta-1,6-N-acetyl-D-glucosamine N-deacetylase
MAWKVGFVAVVLAGLGIFVIGPGYMTLKTRDSGLRGNGCLVLAYHRVLPRPSLLEDYISGQDDYTVYQDSFQKQVETMRSLGASFIRPQEFENVIKRRAVVPSKCVLMTFDDADKSQYDYAFPILKREQIPFLVFIISGKVGAQRFNGMEMATWQDLREMAQSGLGTLGSHTHDMHRVAVRSSRPVFVGTADAAAFAKDLQLSQRTIADEAGQRPTYFAYPFGFGTPQTDEAALHGGMHLLFSLREGINRPGDPAFFVKRFMVTARNWRAVHEWLTVGAE